MTFGRRPREIDGISQRMLTLTPRLLVRLLLNNAELLSTVVRETCPLQTFGNRLSTRHTKEVRRRCLKRYIARQLY
jgi:hypothetical protein